VNEVTNLSTEITGTAEAGSIIKVAVGSKEVGSVETKSDGTFTLTIPAQKAGVVLSITATDKAGNVSAAETVTVEMVTEKSTSRLGHINSGESFIYSNSPGDTNKKSSEEFKHSVYYIKKEATYKKELYYLLSTQSSTTNGTIGWMKASDISSHPHVGVDKTSKTFYVTGTGGAGFDTAWGGSKNHVYPDLKPYKNETFIVNLTEKVGNNIWYRGVLNGKQTWIHSNYVSELNAYVEVSTSRLGHINSGKSSIYSVPYNTADNISSESYKNSVYYIKKQATYDNELYYLLSNNSSAISGTIGWMKATDISSHPHVGVDKKEKTLYVTGTGGAGFTRAWGGSKNAVYADLKQLKGAEFTVDLTERVGNDTWYRGTLNGKQTWVHSKYLSELGAIYKEESTSRLGHINGGKSSIYTTPYNQSSEKSSDSYKNSVYYIKKQATFNGTLYYLLSTRPSATTGIIGWMKAADISSHVHQGLDKKKKVFYVKGSGGAGYDTAWGGSKNHVHADLNSLKNELFIVDLTEKVGNSTWYRGILNGKQTWVHSDFIVDITETYTEQSTSRLGHINTGASLVYASPFDTDSNESSEKYKNSVYYIKKEATYKGQLFYLLSVKPSATNGVIGWMKASDTSSHAHVGVDKVAKTFYVKGTGGAGFDTAWGGRKNSVYTELTSLKDAEFQVDLTEKVGNNIWYRGLLNGKQAWIHSDYVKSSK
jgi:mannosyl-glycoprotein endo-beta-N-acetylglucosaminidase